MKYVPCKHIDHSDTYAESCVLVTIESMGVKYWERKSVPYDGAPVKVQFCGLGRGRINNVFGCYGEMYCYEPAEGASAQ